LPTENSIKVLHSNEDLKEVKEETIHKSQVRKSIPSNGRSRPNRQEWVGMRLKWRGGRS
jgi:hypothetical protein